MRRSKSIWFIMLLFILTLSCGDTGSRNGVFDKPAYSAYVEGEVLVKFRTGVTKAERGVIHSITGAKVLKSIPLLSIERVRLPEGMKTEDGLRFYRSLPEVEYAEPNYIVRKATIPDDTYFNLQWGLNNTGQEINGFKGTPDADIDAPEAWDIFTGGGDVIVAVIDTGVDYTHPDLNGNIWTNTGETNCSDGIDNDSNGYVDDCMGWNFADDNNNPMDNDSSGHGTHVAGIIGAVGNNNTGTSGVNWSVKIMPIKFLNSKGEGTTADEIAAIEYAVKMGARVINASYTYQDGCYNIPPPQSERDIIKAAGDAGVLFVAAAGNYGCNNDNTPFYPASHHLDNIISVASSDINDNLNSWSNYGPDSTHVSAPGDYIYSTIPTALGSYGYMRGTSMAAPHVSGLAALIMSYQPAYSYKQTKETILSSVDQKIGLSQKILTGGRINAYNALSSPGRPVGPTRLTITAISSSQIELSWTDNSSSEDGFIIERKIGIDGSYITLVQLPADTTAYVDTSISLTEGAAYYYKIKAYNSNGESPYSNEVNIIIPPNAPSNLTATAISSSQIELSWTDNSTGETGFKIERKTGADGIYTQIATVGANVTTYSDTGLDSETTYYYRVRAYSTAGDSDYSNEVSATTQAASAGGGGGGGGGGCSIGAPGNAVSSIANLLILLLPLFVVPLLKKRMV